MMNQGWWNLPDVVPAAALGALAVWIGRFLTGYFGSQREAEDIYKQLNEALEKKVQALQKQQQEMLEEVKTLKTQIFELTSKNKGMEGLIILGLQAYFEAHPKEAKAMGRARLIEKI